MTLNCSLSPRGSVKSDLAVSFLIAETIHNNGMIPEDHGDLVIRNTDKEGEFYFIFFTHVTRGTVPIWRHINDLVCPAVVSSVEQGLVRFFDQKPPLPLTYHGSV